jgi:DNA ligase-1
MVGSEKNDMPDIEDGATVEIQGSAKSPYILRNTGGVYSCTCPAWMHQSLAVERRTCKHLRQYRGDEAETQRLGSLPDKTARPARQAKPKSAGTNGGTAGDNGEDAGADSVPGFLLAHSWTAHIDLKGWWMSEKLDGVRAYWDGSKFISRQGNVYLAPDWFVADLPQDTHLDGELWLDRKAFQRAVSIVRRQDKSDDWKQITFVVFDAPQHQGGFEDRVEFLKQRLQGTQSRFARPHEHKRCDDVDHLRTELARVEAMGGEGLMLRKPGSKYESGRSMTLLKVKTFHDAEAVVVAHLPGTGKHKGRLGALSVKLPDGTVFSIGTGFSDAERENPPAIGATVTFRYQELSDGGVPRFPSYVRVRTDLT